MNTIPRTQSERAVVLVQELLDENPTGFWGRDAYARGAEAGISPATINRARRELRLRVKRNGQYPVIWAPTEP